MRFSSVLSLYKASLRVSVLNRQLNTQSTNMSSSASEPTVGIIVIGDEILKGHVQDSNSHFLCRRLFALGVKVKQISVIPDDLDVIAKHVSEFSKSYTHVITSGGIGPTHDDLTFEGVAKAFNKDVYPNPEIVALCKKFFGTDDLNNPKLKLAYVPRGAELEYGYDEETHARHEYPVVRVRNVYVLPGVPHLLRRAFSGTLAPRLRTSAPAPSLVRAVYVARDEMSITSVLNEVDEAFRDRVIMGSYPDFYNSYYKVKLTLESTQQAPLDEAFAMLESRLPPGALVTYDPDPVGNAGPVLEAMLAGGIAGGREEGKREGGKEVEKREGMDLEKLSSAVRVIEQAAEKYPLEELCVGFNGGKDCTVLLHLAFAVLSRKKPLNGTKLKALYIRRGQPFPELEIFIKKCVTKYNLDLITINGRIKDALGELKSMHPEIKAVLMGTRSTDPYSAHLESFSPTDAGWPEYMRVSPILHWTYTDIWTYLRSLNLPYCILYDRGYTSLGSLENTHPNPALQQVDSKGIITYRPAYMLHDGKSEREGRNDATKTPQPEKEKPQSA